MPDAREYKVVFQSAEAAVHAGDFPRAEQLLHDGLRLQEAVLGPAHPDIASTLNNLAVVSETLGKLGEAERFYRQATAVARAALPADDPLLTTSLANLRDFCDAHGRPLDLDPGPTARAPVASVASRPSPASAAPAPAPPWATAPAVAAAVAPASVPPAATARTAAPRAERPPAAATSAASDTPPVAATSPAARTPPAAVTAAAPSATSRGIAGMVAVVALAAFLGWMWLGRDASSTTSPSTQAPSSAAQSSEVPSSEAPSSQTPSESAAAPDAPSPAPDAPTAAPSAPGDTHAPTPAPPTTAAPSPAGSASDTPTPPRATETAEAPRAAPDARERDTAGGARRAGDVRVVAADVCTSLVTSSSPWRCGALGATAAPGRVFFYTRIASPRGARVRHRWSVDGRVRQDVALTVGANQQGYRTFSRQTVTRGRWSVALVGADGTLLHEATFDVR